MSIIAKSSMYLVLVCAVALFVTACGEADEGPGETDETAFANPDPDTCPVSLEPLPDNPYTVEHEGKTYALCCDECENLFHADPVAALAGEYADQFNGGHDHHGHDEDDGHNGHAEGLFAVGNENCPMSGEPVEGVTAVHNGWVIGFCCPGCRGRFVEDPEANADALLQETGHDIRTQLHAVNNEICPDKEEPAEPQYRGMYNGWVVDFCCNGCVRRFNEDPHSVAEALVESDGTDIRESPGAE